MIRLHKGAKIVLKVGETKSETDSTIGVRQGSCEGPTLFLFIIQAAIETMVWPVDKPQFCTKELGEVTGSRHDQKRDITSFELFSSLFADDCALIFNSREDLITGSNYIFTHFLRFGLQIHIGRGGTASKTEAMFCPAAQQPLDSGDQTNYTVADGFVSFSQQFKYLGSIIHQTLTSEADVNQRIKKARAAFGALRNDFFNNKHANLKDKGRIYVALCLSILLYGSECWCLREDLFQRLRVFHNSCVRTMCKVTMRQVMKFKLTNDELFERLNIYSLDAYYNSRLLRWVGHVARMKMSRMPRKLLTGWVNHKRPVGAPQMTYGRTVNKALKSKNITTTFKGRWGWNKIAADKAKWRKLTSKDQPTPPQL